MSTARIEAALAMAEERRAFGDTEDEAMSLEEARRELATLRRAARILSAPVYLHDEDERREAWSVINAIAREER